MDFMLLRAYFFGIYLQKKQLPPFGYTIPAESPNLSVRTRWKLGTEKNPKPATKPVNPKHAMKPEIGNVTKTCHRSRTFLREMRKPSACFFGKLRIILCCTLSAVSMEFVWMSSHYVWRHQQTFRFFSTRNEPFHCCWFDCVLCQLRNDKILGLFGWFIKWIVLPSCIWGFKTK